MAGLMQLTEPKCLHQLFNLSLQAQSLLLLTSAVGLNKDNNTLIELG